VSRDCRHILEAVQLRVRTSRLRPEFVDLTHKADVQGELAGNVDQTSHIVCPIFRGRWSWMSKRGKIEP